MISDFGHICLLFAGALALLQFVLPLSNPNNLRVQFFVQQTAKGQFLLLTISFITLAWAFYSNDFSLYYVANNSNSLLPWYYRLSAVWGGHEGSLLLWIYILSFWGFALVVKKDSLPADFLTRVLAVMGYISLGFIAFIVLTSNPFLKQAEIPFDGRDLNPLLQDVGLIFHPPLLYIGYVGFSVIFSFVVAGLWQGKLDSLWLKRARPWTLAAWISLTLGISLGSYWAYYELGWGGWWFWDPVENASFMPWLIGTALIHSLIASEKRGLFLIWTALLSITAFSLSLIGTFIVRSGVLTSVHAFASDPTRGIFILFLLASILLPALLLLIIRTPKIVFNKPNYRFFSRETGLLANNWLFSGAALIVFIGTLYPLVAELFNLGKISVGAPYFDKMIVPLAFVSLFLLGIAPLLQWKNHPIKNIIPFLIFQLAFALVATSAIALLTNRQATAFLFSVFLTAFALGAIITDYIIRINKQGITGIKNRAGLNGMLLAHFGYLVMIFGITNTQLYSLEKDLRAKEGQIITIADYQIILHNLSESEGPNYQTTIGRFIIKKSDDPSYLAVLTPEKRQYFSSTMPLTESARISKPTHDLYIALGEKIDQQHWAIRLQYKPFIIWIWLGGLMIALGGLIATFDRAYKWIKK